MKNNLSKTLRRIKTHNKKILKEERERLSKIKDFEVGEKVKIKYKNFIREESVIRINSKTYTLSFFEDDKVLISKDTLTGIPNSVYKTITGDGRKFVGENVSILTKKDKLDKSKND